MVVLRISAILAFGLAAAVALAQTPDPDLPPVDPPGHWRQMTLDDATSDSKCVGRFDTPFCAVETVIACFMRARNELCVRATLDGEGVGDFRYGVGNRSRDLYRIVGASRLTEDSILDIPRQTFGVRPGDVRIDIQKRICTMHAGIEDCGRRSLYDPNIYTVRKTTLGWKIVDWGTADVRWPRRKR
jgi:hypothetical protein